MPVRTLVTASALQPQAWPFHVKWLPQPAYLVGGIVRDALLERQSKYLDLDFVMPEGAVETAQAIARHHKAGFVLLDAERHIARVVFEQTTVDFAQQMGTSLEIDLQRRDFTVNAIAYNPHTQELIDPLEGFVDLQQRQLRMVAAHNLEEDPLRLLRAYRQAAQLGFTLEPDTQAVIRQLAPLLGQMAAERVQAELSYLFSSSKGTPWLITAWHDGLLQAWFPHTTLENLELLRATDAAAKALNAACPGFETELLRWIRDKSGIGHTVGRGGARSPQNPNLADPLGSRRTWLTTARLTSLLAPDPQTAEVNLLNLKYSRAELQAVLTVLKCLPQVQSTEQVSALSRRSQYLLFQAVGAAFPALAVLAVASGVTVHAIAPLVTRFLTPNDPVAHPQPLVSGQDLMTALHLPTGPQIGQLLSAIQMAQAEGKVTNAAEALEFAAQLVDLPTNH